MADDRTKEFNLAKQEAHDAIEKLGDQIPPDVGPLIEEAYAKIKVNQIQPKDALKFSPQVMEVIYQHAYQLFQNGKYKDALNIFNILRQFDISDIRYSFAIAACYHYLQQYLDAAANYLIYKYMDPLNPIPCFHLYDCYMKANYPESALLALQQALVLAGDNPQYAGLRNKIELEMEHMKEDIKNSVKVKGEPSA